MSGFFNKGTNDKPLNHSNMPEHSSKDLHIFNQEHISNAMAIYSSCGMSPNSSKLCWI